MTEALVVDDNRQTADALHQMLDVLGVKARVAYGSSAAISILGSGFTPNLICLDVNMPGIDGVEILLYLRREPRLISVPVIVITSDDQPETRRKVMSARPRRTRLVWPMWFRRCSGIMRRSGPSWRMSVWRRRRGWGRRWGWFPGRCIRRRRGGRCLGMRC